MTLNEYQEKAQSFDLTKEKNRNIHQLHAMFQFLEEAGEVAGIYKRLWRGDYAEFNFPHSKLIDELGDCLWGLAAIASSHGYTLSDIAENNIKKLEDRKARNVIKGSGDR